MRRALGFSLIELLIVVAIILIIAAIAVPSYLRARMEANEAAAVSGLRTINTAQVTYSSAYSTVGFAATLTALGGSSCNPPSATSACMIDTVLANGSKTGYSFGLTNVTGTPAAAYQLFGTPLTWNVTGTRYFCSYQDAVVRFSLTTITTCDASVPSLN